MTEHIICGRQVAHGRCDGGCVPCNDGGNLRDPRDMVIERLQ